MGSIFLLVYSNNIIVTSSCNEVIEDVICQFKNEFKLKDLASSTNLFGMEVRRTAGRLLLDQRKYISVLLIKTGLDNTEPLPTPMTGT